MLLNDPPAIKVGPFVLRETAFGVVKRLRFIVDQLEIERQRLRLRANDLQVLDLGCGTGTYVTLPLAEMGYNVLGLDADQSSIDRARQNAATARSSRVEFVCGRLEKLSCRSFHVVICSEVVEHVSSPADFLSAIHPILMKSGVLILTVPNGYGYFEFESAFTRVSPKFPYFAERFERWLVRTFGSSRLRNRHYVEYGGLDSDRDRQRNELEQSSLAIDQTHYQRFTPKKIRGVIAEGGFEITSFQNNTFLAGNILNALIRSSDRLLLLNGRLADFLPHRMAADWLIAARKTVRSVDRSFVASCGVE